MKLSLLKIMTTLFLASLLGACEFLAVDKCLDAGGSYDYENSICDYEKSHKYQ